MVHTAEMCFTTSNKMIIQRIFNSFGFSGQQQDNLTQQLIIYKDGKQIHCPCSRAAYEKVGHIIPGIKSIAIRFMYTDSSFKVTIRIEPNLLMTEKRSTDVFLCSKANKEALINKFYVKLGDVIGYDNPDILDLHNWLTERIDFTHNINLGSSEAVKTFEAITKRTNRNSYSSKSLHIKGKSWDMQSTANGNKSSKNILYDKQQQIIDEYDGMPEDELNELINEAEGVARFEVQCDKGKVFSLLASTVAVKPRSRSIIDYMSEPLAEYLLTQRYAELIGWGDFYSLNAAIEKINDSALKPCMKEKLINFMRLASQSKSIATLRKNFIKGTKLNKYKDKNGNPITIDGNPAKYLNWVRKLASIGINAMPIARARDLDYFKNPVTPSEFKIMEA